MNVHTPSIDADGVIHLATGAPAVRPIKYI